MVSTYLILPRIFPPFHQLSFLFVTGSLAMFDALNPKQLPLDNADVFTYAPAIMPVATRFGFNGLKLSEEFARLLDQLLEDHENEYCMHRNNDDPARFWSHFLGHEGILWPDQLRELVQLILCLPVGSADAERGFSILKHTRYDRRSRLTPEHLQQILAIRINGPPIEKFQPRKYTLRWLQHHRESSDPRGQRQPPPELERPSEGSEFLTRSNLF